MDLQATTVTAGQSCQLRKITDPDALRSAGVKMILNNDPELSQQMPNLGQRLFGLSQTDTLDRTLFLFVYFLSFQN